MKEVGWRRCVGGGWRGGGRCERDDVKGVSWR